MTDPEGASLDEADAFEVRPNRSNHSTWSWCRWRDTCRDIGEALEPAWSKRLLVFVERRDDFVAEVGGGDDVLGRRFFGRQAPPDEQLGLVGYVIVGIDAATQL
jgi:hypothetical protein